MIQSVKDAITVAKVDGLAEMLHDGQYAKRSLSALAKGIGESEEATVALLAQHFPAASKSVGRQSGKVFYALS